MSGDRDLTNFLSGETGQDDSSQRISRALRAVRCHLGLQVAYVSKFAGECSIFREVDAPGLEHLIKVGDSRSLNDVYCRHVLEGRLPQLIPDTSANPLAMSIPITKAASIGAHISVPILLPDGEVYGMFCCLGFEADNSLNERDLQTMKAFAEIASFEINRELEAAGALEEKRARITGAIDEDVLSIVFQPIWDVEAMRPVGFECLARFASLPYRSPDKWFAEAAEIGMGPMLELHAIQRALKLVSSFPPDIYLGLNASPALILGGEFAQALREMPLERLIVEITEHSIVDSYEELLAVLRPLRERGLRLAIDDTGAGYSSLRHILNMRPDFIKLDMTLTQNVDLDPARKALARALVGFAKDTGSRIIAEGVERQSELEMLRTIGVRKVQGYLLGRPMTLDDALKLCSANPRDGRIAAA
jgi:EAL domain-containing protein (putative c-di-GMP-specific phosphodiesterase class I)